jgi:hypothetical protein
LHLVAGTEGGAIGEPGLLRRASARLGKLYLGGPCISRDLEAPGELLEPAFPGNAGRLERTRLKQTTKQVGRKIDAKRRLKGPIIITP